MLHKYIKNIEPHDKFTYIVIIIACILLFRRLELSSHVLVGIIAGILIVVYLNDHKQSDDSTFIVHMKKILNSPLLKPHLYHDLHRDSELVIFLDSYKEYNYYNPDAYHKLVRGINDLLRIRSTIEISKNYHADYDVMRELKVSILNTFHSFVYKIPHTESTMVKYQHGLVRLETLLNHHIDAVHRVTAMRDKDAGVSTSSRFPHRNHPKSYDSAWKTSFNYF